MSISGVSSKTRTQRWKIMANKSKENPWPKRELDEEIRGKPDMKGEVAVYLSPMGAART